MKRLPLPCALAAAAAGLVLASACSGANEPPATTDATACTCPAADPPLVASRFTTVKTTASVPASQQYNSLAVECPAGTQVISGSCLRATGEGNDLTLRQFGVQADTPSVWRCEFRNDTTKMVDVVVSATCLTLAP